MADTPDPQELARRYLDLWQQHLTQAATDPELTAGMAKLLQVMPMAGAPYWPSWPAATADDGAAQRTAAAGNAPDLGSDGFDELLSRLDAIEKRLGALERKPGASRKRPAKGSGKSRS